MFTFDLSATDFILAVAIVTLFVFVLSDRRSRATTVKDTHDNKENISRKSNLETKNNKEKKPSDKLTPTNFQKCVHRFGYLKNLPQNTPVPDECFGCPEVMRCLFPNDQAQTEQQITSE